MMLQDRGDLIVATGAIGGGQPGAQEDAVIEFLNSDLVLRWAEVTLRTLAPGAWPAKPAPGAGVLLRVRPAEYRTLRLRSVGASRCAA